MPTSNPDSDLLARVTFIEQEVAKLRDFRHNYASDKMATLLTIEKMEAKIAQIRGDFAEGRVDHAHLATEVAGLRGELDLHQRAYALKIAEYDRERSVAGGILKPIVIFILIGLTGGVIALLVKMYVMFGAK